MLSTETINIGYLLARVELLYLDPILESQRRGTTTGMMLMLDQLIHPMIKRDSQKTRT